MTRNKSTQQITIFELLTRMQFLEDRCSDLRRLNKIFYVSNLKKDARIEELQARIERLRRLVRRRGSNGRQLALLG